MPNFVDSKDLRANFKFWRLLQDEVLFNQNESSSNQTQEKSIIK